MRTTISNGLRAALATALALAVVVVVPVPSRAGSLVPIPCPFTTGDATIEAKCSTLRVPLFHAAPGGRSIRIAIARLHHVGDAAAARRPPAVFLNGGPGGATLVPLGPLGAVTPAVRRADLIFVDQRGTGLARPRLVCPEIDEAQFAALRRPGDPLAEARRNVRAAARCAARLRRAGIPPAAFNTSENASDLVALRRTLGLRRWDVIAPSYGSTLAFQLLHRLRDRALVGPDPGPSRIPARSAQAEPLTRPRAPATRPGLRSLACRGRPPTSRAPSRRSSSRRRWPSASPTGSAPGP